MGDRLPEAVIDGRTEDGTSWLAAEAELQALYGRDVLGIGFLDDARRFVRMSESLAALLRLTPAGAKARPPETALKGAAEERLGREASRVLQI